MKGGQDEFFAVIGEGAALLKALDESSPGFFDSLNRLREILAILGYASPAKPLPFSLADPDGSARALYHYLDTSINQLPDELAVFEAGTVAELASLIGNGKLSQAAQEWASHNRKSQSAINATTKEAVFAHFSARGIEHGIAQADLEQALKDADALLSRRPEDDPEYAEARARYDQINKERRQALNALAAMIDADRSEGRDVADLLRQHADLAERTGAEQNDAWDRLKGLHDKFNDDRINGHRALFEANGAAILAKVAESSPITQEQADGWAAEQVIDDNARAKLKRLGYKPEDVMRDMAEFYRMTGGKASAIRISIDGGKRANAVGITERLGEKVINLGGRFNKTVLFHELAHHLENDPIAKAASNGYLLKRRESDTVYRLRDLTGLDYDKREIAYKDSFPDAYVGKVYRDGITEVWSMGVQYLANPKDAAIFAAKDPEMFALITGYLSAPLTPAMSAKLNMHKGAIGAMQEKKQSLELQYARAIDYLADRAPITADDWFSTLDRESLFAEMLFAYVLTKDRRDGVKYVGSSGQYKVFSGTFRNIKTKRNAKGFVIVDAATGGTSDGDYRTIPDAFTVHGDLSKVRAVIALASRDGTGLARAWTYFVDTWGGSAKEKLIETVGAENLQ